MSKHTILCGTCGTPVQGPENPKSADTITCPNCGQSDSYETVLDSAKAFVTDRVAESLNKSMADAVRGSKHVKMKSTNAPARQHRWVVADFDV